MRSRRRSLRTLFVTAIALVLVAWPVLAQPRARATDAGWGDRLLHRLREAVALLLPAVDPPPLDEQGSGPGSPSANSEGDGGPGIDPAG